MPSVSRICALHGGLQARSWQAKIGLQSFVDAILANHVEVRTKKKKPGLLCQVVKSPPRGPSSGSMNEISPMEVTM